MRVLASQIQYTTGQVYTTKDYSLFQIIMTAQKAVFYTPFFSQPGKPPALKDWACCVFTSQLLAIQQAWIKTSKPGKAALINGIFIIGAGSGDIYIDDDNLPFLIYGRNQQWIGLQGIINNTLERNLTVNYYIYEKNRVKKILTLTREGNKITQPESYEANLAGKTILVEMTDGINRLLFGLNIPDDATSVIIGWEIDEEPYAPGYEPYVFYTTDSLQTLTQALVSATKTVEVCAKILVEAKRKNYLKYILAGLVGAGAAAGTVVFLHGSTRKMHEMYY